MYTISVILIKSGNNACIPGQYDIGLIRLSEPMQDMRTLELSFIRPRAGMQTEMAGTGLIENV